MILSTTNIDRPYDVLDVVFVLHGEQAAGFLGTGGIDINTAMASVKKLLIEKAKALGADAIVGCDFEQRIAVSSGMVNKQVLELFAFGTAIKFKDMGDQELARPAQEALAADPLKVSSNVLRDIEAKHHKS